MFFDNWQGVMRILLVGTLAYVALIFLLRISGKRTLSKMNAFDLIVTVALGSTLATILLSEKVVLVEGLTALALLIGLQFLMTWLSVRSRTIGSLLKAEPRLLFFRGEFLSDAMRCERVTHEEILQAMRTQGTGQVQQPEAVVLETDGSLSVISNAVEGPATVLEDVQKDAVSSGPMAKEL